MLRETRNSLVEVFNTHDAGSLVIGDQQFDDLVQKYFLSKTDNEIYERVIKPMISRNIYESEAKAAGSAEIYLRLLFEYFQFKNNKFTNIDWDKTNSILNYHAKIKPLRTEIMRFIDQKCTSDISSIVKEAIVKSQRDDQIEVIRGNDLKTSLRLIPGCNFDTIKVDPAYYHSKNWKKSEVNIILIDGIIEKSVHVEHVLMLSNKDNVPYVIICREATDEVKNACLTNFLRQTTDVVLCTAPYSEKTAHLFEDLKLITSADVITPEMGDIISVAMYKKSKSIKKIEIGPKGISIENGKDDELKEERLRLLKSMHEINDENVSDLIRKRIKTLSSNRLVINIGSDVLMKQRNAIEQIDKVLRETKDVISTGMINVQEEIPYIKHSKAYCSVNSVRTGISTFLSFVKILDDNGLILMRPFTF